MKNVLLLACASIVLTMGASAALADDNRYYDNGYYGNGGNSWQDNNRYYNDDYYDNGASIWRFLYQNNGYYSDYSRQRDWNNDGYDYSQNVVSPRSIVRNLQRHGYSYISNPALAGRLYQVKARDPNGHKVKLYIDAYSGRIVKVKT
jgi:Peptidase propeptide and YPEB domain